jgi:excisionase family DNA binding protein
MSATLSHAGGSAPATLAVLLDVDEVAGMLGCSARTVRRLADGGRMPQPTKLGSLLRFNRASIEKWVADGCPNCRHAGKGASR